MKTNFNIQKEIISHLKSSARVYQGYRKGIRFVATILVSLWIGVGSAWADYTVTFSTSSFAFASGGEYVSSSEKSTNGWEATTDGFKYGASKNTGYTEFTMTSSGTDIGQIKASKITFKDVLVFSSDGSSLGYIITYVGGETKSGTVLAPASAADKDVELDDTKTIQKIKIYSTANKKRFYCKGFTVVAAAAASCGLPTSPSNGAKTAATQPVSWSAPSPAPGSGYLVAIGATSTPPGDNVQVNSSQTWGDYYVNVVSAGTSLTFTSSNGAWYAGTEYHWWVRSKCGASDYSAWVAGTAFTIPNIETSTTAIEGLGYDVSSDGPGTAQSFTVSGAGLTGNLTASLISGSDFEISQTSATSGFANSLTLIQSSGTVSATIWVRLKSGRSADDYLEEITISGGTATSQTVAIEGVVCSKLAAPTGLTLSEDHGGTHGRTRFGWNEVAGASGYIVTVSNGVTSGSVETASDRYYYITTYPAGNYTWSVKAKGDGTTYCSNGTSADGSSFCVSADLTGSTPTGLSISNVAETSVRFNWTAVANAAKYKVTVKNSGTPISGFDNKETTNAYMDVTGLTAGTTYTAEVTAYNACEDAYKSPTANTTIKILSVTFNSNGGSAVATQYVNSGGTASTPSAPTKDGYSFGAWQLNSSNYNFSTPVTSNITLVATWSAATYTVTLDKQSGTGGSNSVTATYNADMPVATMPTRDGYNFLGYFGSTGGSGTKYYNADGSSARTWNVASNTTIYAHWTAKTYTNYRTTCSTTYDIVLHDNNGGSHNGSAKVADGGTLLTSITAPTRDHYHVLSYHTGTTPTNANKICDNTGNPLTSNLTGYTDATGHWNKDAGATFYANWEINSNTLTWEYDGGTPSGSYTAAGSVAYGTSLTTPTVTKTGYTFNAWSPAVPGTMPDADATYTATWTAHTYSVRFNANGGSGSMSNQNFTYGVAQNLTSNGFTAPSEKSFGGWTTNSDGTGDLYTNGQEVSNLTSVNGATVDLYAKWVDCDLYTVMLKVNNDTYMTLTQGSCGSAVDLNGITPPACGGGYTFRGWSTTNSATPTFDMPTITTSYTPEENTTLYAVYSHTAVVGTQVMSTASISEYEYYYVVASGFDKVMAQPTSTTNLAAAIDVTKSADGSKCYVTGNGTPFEIMFSDKSTYWMISKYNSSTGNNWYYYSQSSRNALAWYNEDDYAVWWIDDYIEKYGEWYDAEDYVASSTASSKWSISIDGSGNATISETTNSRTWKYNSGDVKFGAYTSGNKPISLYQLDESGVIYTTQPDMTVYTITKGAENPAQGTYTIPKGVACGSDNVAVTATPAAGYAFNGWTSSNGGTFANASSASTTFTPTANTTVTATFVARVQHDITWMVNGAAYTTGIPTDQLYGGDSFSTMTLPTAPANNTLSSACGAVANQFVGWSTTDMGFATGQSAPAKLFTNATGAGTAYGTMGDDDVTFYAVFAKDGSSNYMSRCADTYSITLDKKEGTTDGTAVATEMGSALDITLAPAYAGHSIEGYYAETGLTTKIANANGTLVASKSGYTDGSGKWINTTSPLTLYTKWTLNSHTLTWNLDGGAISVAGTSAGAVSYGTTLVAPTVTKTGYTFAGWSPAVTSTMPDEDVTYTATWTADQYAITYKDQGDAAYSGSNGGLLPAKHTYGTATDLPNGVKAGYRFDGWYLTDECTGDPITSIGATAYTSGITLYAKWTASHTFTFSKNGVVDGTLTLGQVEGGNVVMPNTTVDCGLWTTFEGWVIGDVAETTTEPATVYKPGDIFVAGNSNQEFKALYSKHEGDATVYYEKVTSGPKSGEYIMVSAPKSEKYYTTTGWNSSSSIYSTAEVTLSASGTVSAANATSASANVFTVHAGYGANAGKFAIYDGAKYMSSGSSISRQDAQSYSWNLLDGTTKVNAKEYVPGAGAIHSTTSDTYVLQLRNHTSADRFSMYANTQNYDVYLYRKKVAGTTYYATAPTCSVPTEVVVSYNDNKANAGEQTIEGMPSGTTLDFTSYPDFASYTIGAAPTDPTGYHFAGWNTSADGSGDSYAAGASVTTFGYVENITLYAQWERVYTVTLMDNGVERTRLKQASAGANVTLPSGNNCTPSSAFTFEGWTESSVHLNASPVRPAAATLHAAGAYAPTSDITLYSVYSRSVEGCADFAAGVSGAYKMQDRSSSNYAVVTSNANRYDKNASDATAEKFYVAYSSAKSAYTIRTSLGYLGWSGGTGSETLTKDNMTPYYWTIREGTGAAAGYWQFKPMGVSGKQFSGANTYFNIHSDGTAAFIQLTKTAMTYYYNTAICTNPQIKFHAGGGVTISGTPTTPDGASWNSSTHVLSGLEDCAVITVFPTASYDGWEFVGWSTEDYSNSGKHATDYEDENGSTDEPDASTIYGDDKNPYLVMGGSITLYPVFTRVPNNEPFDMENGGDYVMYYMDESGDDGYGAAPRKYAGEWSTKRYVAASSCASATVFTFTKDGDVWHIQNKSNGKYLGGQTGDDGIYEVNELGTLTDWTITIREGNQFNATCQSGRQLSVYDNHFMNYSSGNLSLVGYNCIYLGSCEERIFSSEPNATPILDLSGELTVTSSVGQTIRASEVLTLSGSHLDGATKVTLSGANLKFATSATATPVANMEVSVSEGRITTTSVYVYYTPTATEDGVDNVIVTAVDNGDAPVTKKVSIQVRHLPADFVIAAKASNGKWYALPADIIGSTSPTNGVLIEVDDDEDPTTVTSAPNNVKWGLRNVKLTRQTSDGLGHYLTFTERLSTATADNQKTLYNGSTTSIQAYAMWNGYATTNPEQYEWIPTTTDLKDYTLTSAKTFDGEAGARTLSMNTSGVFGSLFVGKAYEGKVRLLPAEFYTNAAAQIIEWKDRSVVVMYTGTQTTATTKVGANSASSAQTLSSQKLTHGVYELTTSQSLASNDGKKLEITFGGTEKLIVEIPVIITGTSTASDNHASQDLIILKNAKLTAATTKYSYRNVYVYGGGKLDIPTGTSLGVNNIILRAGGVTTDGTGGSAEYEYVYPQVGLVGTLTSSIANIKYEYVTDNTMWYQLCLPFDANYTSITYPQEYYGSTVAVENHGSWMIKRYDGATRATGDYDAWVDIETDWKKDGDPKTIYAGHGYIYWGAPKKVTIGGVTERQAWGIQRMTMAIAAETAKTAEASDKAISGLAAHNGAGQINDQGWNMIGNPYMVNLTGLESTSIRAGKLEHEIVNGNWTGGWVFDATNENRYVTVPDDRIETYEAIKVAGSDMTLTAGKVFFVQLDGGATAIQFAAEKRATLAPAWQHSSETSQAVDVETGIVLSNAEMHDEVNFWIKDGKTEAYEFNADYPKMPNKTDFNIYGVHQTGNLSWVAISPEIAEGDMAIGYQVPAAGDYMLSMSEKYITDEIESVFVTDHGVSPEITTDLMVSSYNFTVHQAETNNERFTISFVFREEKIDVTTGTQDGMVDSKALKFIHDDKMYILHGGVIYDATGKRVNVINK